jgi:hypothetical protein
MVESAVEVLLLLHYSTECDLIQELIHDRERASNQQAQD